MVDLPALPPLQIAQTKKVAPLLPTSSQNKEGYLKELFTKLEIEQVSVIEFYCISMLKKKRQNLLI